MSFVLVTGGRHETPPKAGDDVVARVFGETVLAVLTDAVAAGTFAGLPLQDDCQLDVEEYDGMWAWPARHADLGRTNLIRDLPAERLSM